MANRYKLPSLGENVQKAQVIGVLVAPGDQIQKDQSVIEVETDKASLEVPAPASGTVAEVLVRAGDEIEVGKDFIVIEGDGAEPAAAPQGRQEAPAKAEPQSQSQSQPKREPEPEPEPESQPQPAPARQERPAGGDAAAAPARPAQAAGSTGSSSTAAGSTGPGRGAFAAPSVRRFAREIGVEIDEVQGSGPGGRISIADVKQHARSTRPLAPGGRPQDYAGGLEFRPREEPFERRPLTNVRRTIAERMSFAWTTIPHVTLTARADVTEVEEVRLRYKSKGSKVTITAILLKVMASALKVFPEVNASLAMQEGELIVKREVHLGVAVDTERGLLVPVVRDADKKNILELSSDLAELSERARNGKLKPDEMKGAGCTLTNLGGLGIAEFTPIVNPPEVAVLGVGRAETVASFTEDGELVAKSMLPLSLSIDHRVLDGADGARFLQWIVRALEDPLVLALEG